MRRLRMPHRLIMLAAALCALLLVSRGAGVSQAAAVPTSVSTSPITGQQGKMLLFFAMPAGGGETSVACASIDAAVFDPPNLVLKEMPQSGNPCEGGTPDAFVLPGMTTITAGVYVGGAPQYTVQVDCAGCCAGGQYCSDVGRASRFAAGVTDSDYTVSVAGDNLERWRVWVINEDGTPGDFSDWRTFDVDSSGAARLGMQANR